MQCVAPSAGRWTSDTQGDYRPRIPSSPPRRTSQQQFNRYYILIDYFRHDLFGINPPPCRHPLEYCLVLGCKSFDDKKFVFFSFSVLFFFPLTKFIFIHQNSIPITNTNTIPNKRVELFLDCKRVLAVPVDVAMGPYFDMDLCWLLVCFPVCRDCVRNSETPSHKACTSIAGGGVEWSLFTVF